MNTAKRIRHHIARIPSGTPFTAASLVGLGPRASVDQALSRMTRTGRITRVSRGVYMRPVANAYVSSVMPAASQVANSVAKATHSKLQVHGAEAARQLGLSTQMATKPVYLTSGPSRRIRLGKLEIVLKSASPQQMALAGRPAGTALAALRYLGKGAVTPATIKAIRKQLPAKEFEALRNASFAMPGWLVNVFHAYRKEFEHGDDVPRAA